MNDNISLTLYLFPEFSGFTRILNKSFNIYMMSYTVDPNPGGWGRTKLPKL
jgi:hypothetical protein